MVKIAQTLGREKVMYRNSGLRDLVSTVLQLRVVSVKMTHSCRATGRSSTGSTSLRCTSTPRRSAGSSGIDGVFDEHNYRAALWNSGLLDFEKVVVSLFT